MWFITRVWVPYVREWNPEALASRKVVCREAGTEGSETAKVGTDEQESDKRQGRSDKVSHHIDVQTQKRSICHVDPAAIDRRNMLLPGEVLD